MKDILLKEFNALSLENKKKLLGQNGLELIQSDSTRVLFRKIKKAAI